MEITIFLFIVFLPKTHPCPGKCICTVEKVICRKDLLGFPDLLKVKATDITYLVIDNSHIERLHPQHLRRFENLERLYLQNVSLSLLHRDAFGKTETLRELSLSSNKLRSIENGTFSRLKNLEILILGNNQLTTIHSHMFRGLHRLKYLQLTNNTIKRIEPGSFDSIPKLEWLDMNECGLSRLESHLFAGKLNLAFDHFLRGK